MIFSETTFKIEAVKIAAYLLAENARTAPKSRGQDSLDIVYIDGYELRKLCEEMKKISEELNDRVFKRDAESIEKSQGVLLIGVESRKPLNLNCGGCGYKSCEEFQKALSVNVKFTGPSCIFKLLDLGIAVGSVAKLSSILGLDTRIMYTAGFAAKRLEYVKGDVVLAIPIATLGKNPFFDRKD
ncbi:MAG: DUF2148 domain-containing protein [Archaeoglobaceae archaeon]|nr:DUF2148 domain-containing protein [Archaeoglobaceae archaeon]MCX8151517.1 DUF2148 domain-containing protein [Archaeoglobaceae archaeon]MDW8013247.1 DUF2148 domain-containing protein [Archaeoglobaceae archaeon]